MVVEAIQFIFLKSKTIVFPKISMSKCVFLFLLVFLFVFYISFFFFLPSTHVIGKGTPHHSGSWSHQGACHSSLQGACYWPESSSPQQNSSQFKTFLKQELFSKLQYNINTWNTGSFVHVVQCTLICCQGDELIRLKSYCSIHAKKITPFNVFRMQFHSLIIIKRICFNMQEGINNKD